MIVTIDGPAGSGKSTTARLVAQAVGFGYLDSGALYRAVALKWLDTVPVGESKDSADLGVVVSTLDLQVRVAADSSLSFELDGRDISERIREERVGSAASVVSAEPVVRDYVTDIQRRFARELETRGVGVVVEGRDIGTVVFPDADVKYFLDAAPRIRAERRFSQLRERGVEADLEEILQQIRIRDSRDRERAVAPLRPAEDAIVLDTSDMTTDEIVNAIAERIQIKATT